jgi:hypothetical protein
MPATHARFLRRPSQAKEQIMPLQSLPQPSNSMARHIGPFLRENGCRASIAPINGYSAVSNIGNTWMPEE